jgi:hypothetical protein
LWLCLQAFRHEMQLVVIAVTRPVHEGQRLLVV